MTKCLHLSTRYTGQVPCTGKVICQSCGEDLGPLPVIEMDQFTYRTLLGEWWVDAVKQVPPIQVVTDRNPGIGYVWLRSDEQGLVVIYKANWDSSG